MIVPLSPASLYFWDKHKEKALSEMGLPLDLDQNDLELIVLPVEIKPFKDRWIEKCPKCKEWFVGGTFCCKDCFYAMFRGGFYHVKFYFDFWNGQPCRITFFKLRAEVTKYFDEKIKTHKKSKGSKSLA